MNLGLSVEAVGTMVRRYRAEAVNLDRHSKDRAKSQTGVAVNLISRTRTITRGGLNHCSTCSDPLKVENAIRFGFDRNLGPFSAEFQAEN